MLEPGFNPQIVIHMENNTLESLEGEHRIRDLNDEINKDLREKGYWEDQLPGTRMEVTVIFFSAGKVGTSVGKRIPQVAETTLLHAEMFTCLSLVWYWYMLPWR